MPLEHIALEVPIIQELPTDVSAFLSSAKECEDQFREDTRHRPIASYIASNFERVYSGLLQLSSKREFASGSFLEWGSGFGIVAALAAWCEYEAYGIEIETDLVQAAEELCERFELPVEFACGSFVPDSDAAHQLSYGDGQWKDLNVVSGYRELGLDLDEFDFVYLYPWPGEELAMRAVFEHGAKNGAVLIEHHAVQGMQLFQKVAALDLSCNRDSEGTQH